MANDLELIKKLEKEINKKLKMVLFSEIDSAQTPSYSVDKNGHINGLNLDDIKLYPFPESLSKFSHIEKLSLIDTQTDLFFLRDFLGDVPLVDINEKKLTNYSFIKNFANLTHLNLADNKISDISYLYGLKKIRKLDLRYNKIDELPEEILGLELKIDVETKKGGGKGIFLYGNPLEIPPIEVLKKGKEAIKIYFKSLEEEKILLNEVKVMLVGDGGTGKTSLMKRLLGQKFDKNEPLTHGININHWQIKSEKEKIHVRLWDFGGQEIMHATHQFFLSKRSLYILVLDGRKEEKIQYWLKHIQSFGGNSPVLVVLNKIDLNPGFDVNRKFLKEKYQNIRGFFRVSCSNKEGIDTFSDYLIRELKKVELIRGTWAKRWFNVKTRLENMTKPFINYDQYKRICKEERILDNKTQDILLDYLHDLGVILHFKDFDLEETHVLEPKWVTGAVYKIITSKELALYRGVLKLRLLNVILEKKKRKEYSYPRDKYKYIIGLMKKFELCYEMDTETVLIPDLLPDQEPDFEFDGEKALGFIIQYDFLPRSIMPRLIVNMHKEIKDQMQWRTGMMLENAGFQATAVVKADHYARRIHICVNGLQKREYFAVILAALRRINQSFEKLKTTEHIPLPDNPEVTANYQQLIRFEEEGIEFYYPAETRKKYRVKDLLGSIEPEIEKSETLQMLKQIKIDHMQRKAGEIAARAAGPPEAKNEDKKDRT
jgi:small GTP-binding protein